MIGYAISATKANRLYWLGRYAERVYISLHLLRRYYDRMIDGDSKDEEIEYYKRIDASCTYPDAKSFKLGYMYDKKNPSSLISGIEQANDNAIVLREEIMSETFSYIQLSLCHIQKEADLQDENINNLQCITDYLLAFWGSIDERVFDERIRNLLRMGKLVENIDMHIRFNYPYMRIREAYDALKKCSDCEERIFDPIMLKQLDELITEDEYNVDDLNYKNKVLKYINHLVLL
ncbi:alpha-E domain-containing protein [uncultured Bacteroides sp.]|uniref:alpha-E domain-containing protein n=1 Tax=uncultured Bacteroides sp. TaxID=162156 RepID=UPI0026033850|nr:alpha-E domain-containing protein [uncultured Bacteroides sp.]